MNQAGAFKDVAIDRVAEFWNQRPCNIRHSPKPRGSKDYFDEVEKRKYFVEPHIPVFADFPRWRGCKVLEIGCGLGTDTMNFARHGAQVTAVDLSEESLKLARQRAEVYGLSDAVRFYQANCEELSEIVPVEDYDLVYSFGVIHHTPNPDKALEQAKKYMNAATELRLMIYSKVSYKLFRVMQEEDQWDMGAIDEIMAKRSEAQSGCPVTYTYTFDEARQLLAGFDIVSQEKAHIFTWDVPHYIQYQYVKAEPWKNVSDQELAALEKELGWHMLLKARLAG